MTAPPTINDPTLINFVEVNVVFNAMQNASAYCSQLPHLKQIAAHAMPV
jgi:hypothetical protein